MGQGKRAYCQGFLPKRCQRRGREQTFHQIHSIFPTATKYSPQRTTEQAEGQKRSVLRNPTSLDMKGENPKLFEMQKGDLNLMYEQKPLLALNPIQNPNQVETRVASERREQTKRRKKKRNPRPVLSPYFVYVVLCISFSALAFIYFRQMPFLALLHNDFFLLL